MPRKIQFIGQKKSDLSATKSREAAGRPRGILLSLWAQKMRSSAARVQGR
jgi:hypothetical protein